jgi:hypothetical protein
MQKHPTLHLANMVFGCIAASAVMVKDVQAQGLGVSDAVNNSDLSRRLHLTVDGWANFGFSYNPIDPGNRYNGPVTFNDRDREVQLNQLYLLIERHVDKRAGQWDVGGRVDFLFGSDAQFAQAQGAPNGHWDTQLTGNRFYNIALPQAYAELYAPWGNGITAKIGHFYTIIGNESVMAPDNFFYSHSYTMQYGEPFTHTGVLFDYPLLAVGSDALSGWTLNTKLGAVTGGTTGGWDAAFDHGLGAWRFLGGVSLISPEGDTSFDVTASSGPTAEQNAANWSLYSLVLKHQLATPVQYAVQFDHGRVESQAAQSAAEWMGLVNSLTYAINAELAAGVRLEWFRDDDNFRALSPAREGLAASQASSYYAVTVGLKWQPNGWLTFRPNARYDWSDGSRPFDGGNSGTQWLVSLDCTLRF